MLRIAKNIKEIGHVNGKCKTHVSLTYTMYAFKLMLTLMYSSLDFADKVQSVVGLVQNNKNRIIKQ